MKLRGKKIVKIIKTLFAVVIICANCIIVISNNNDKAVNSAEFNFVEERIINSAEFNLTGGNLND